MWVIRRQTDGWYYTGDKEAMYHPNIHQAQTYLAPPNTWAKGVWVEQREPWQISLPVILILSTLVWVAVGGLLYALLTWPR